MPVLLTTRTVNDNTLFELLAYLLSCNNYTTCTSTSSLFQRNTTVIDESSKYSRVGKGREISWTFSHWCCVSAVCVLKPLSLPLIVSKYISFWYTRHRKRRYRLSFSTLIAVSVMSFVLFFSTTSVLPIRKVGERK